MTPTPETISAAGALMRQYGPSAAVIAVLRAAEEAARGDLAASDFWTAVAELCEAEDEAPNETQN
jgi:DsbC/DsbD-like thiol-disulfide interchange protein